ncbi:PAS domain-containing protein [Candidatus Methylocalor cossyra]|uniref:Aerotaxis receptor n=1 Tax=Candidatus Methylocalor cossyra TaxID=3108543 RepID=A0ABM9NF51_9GAMM
MQDMKPEDIVGEYREYTLQLYGYGRRRVLVTDIETPYPEGRLIVSRTDPTGLITQVNRSFVLMSGYDEEELIGSPHSILRHPDMPSPVFRDLWETIGRGQTWQGYVKNLRKDGGFYWVKATVIPNLRGGQLVGYTSVRRKPSRQMVQQAELLYRTMGAPGHRQ